jgi:hypothetical protein
MGAHGFLPSLKMELADSGRDAPPVPFCSAQRIPNPKEDRQKAGKYAKMVALPSAKSLRSQVFPS